MGGNSWAGGVEGLLNLKGNTSAETLTVTFDTKKTAPSAIQTLFF